MIATIWLEDKDKDETKLTTLEVWTVPNVDDVIILQDGPSPGSYKVVKRFFRSSFRESMNRYRDVDFVDLMVSNLRDK